MINNKILLMKNTFYNETTIKLALADFILKSNKLSMGEHVFKFENEFSEWQQKKYSVMVNSGSSANLLLIQACINLGLLNKNDKVGFSSVTWATNVMPIIQLGLDPIPINISKTSVNINLEYLEDAHKKYNIKCLFITNLLGFCDELDKISTYCATHNILLLEDNCESMGSTYKGIKLGNFGLASTFSTFVGHHLSTIEGGMICTNDIDLYNMLVMCRAHGWDRNIDDDYKKKYRETHNILPFYYPYTFYELGYNLRPTEIQGFIGSHTLPFMNEICNKRSNNYNKILNNIIPNNKYFIPTSLPDLFNSNFAIPIICENKEFLNILFNILNKYNIECRPIVGGNIVSQPFFKKYLSTKSLEYINEFEYQNAIDIHNNGVYLPNNPELNDEEISRIIKALNEAAN